MLSFLSLPWDGFCWISELLVVPRRVIGKVQLSPDATLMSPVEFSPQSASSIDLEHSGAASAIETDVGLEAPAISARAARLDTRITGASICDPLTLALPRLFVEQLIQPSAMPNE